MSWMARCDELGDRREPVELGNSVGSDVDAALTFKAGHGRVVNEPLDRAARERGARCGHRTPPRESLARKPIRGKPFTREFHCHRDFPASPWCACAQWPRSLHGILGVVLVGIVRVANRLRILSAQVRTTCAWMADLARIAPVYRDAALIACHYVGVGLASRMALE